MYKVTHLVIRGTTFSLVSLALEAGKKYSDNLPLLHKCGGNTRTGFDFGMGGGEDMEVL